MSEPNAQTDALTWAEGANYHELYQVIGHAPRFAGGRASVAEAEMTRRLTVAMTSAASASEASGKRLLGLTWVLVLLTVALVALTIVLVAKGP